MRPRRPRQSATQRRRLVASAALALVVGAASFALFDRTTFGERLELTTVDSRFAARADRPAARDIVILRIDNDTDQRLGQRFPYPRATHGEVARALHAAGARVVAFDIEFAYPSPIRGDDARFVDSLAAAGPIVLAAGRHDGRANAELDLPFGFVELPGGSDPLLLSGASVGATGVRAAADGARRELALRASERLAGETDAAFPSFALATLAAAEGEQAASLGRQLPGAIQLNYNGDGREARFSSYQYADVVEAARSGTARQDLAWARDRIVLVGATSAVLQDIHATPVGRLPGVEVHATALQNARERSWLRPAPSATAAVVAASLVLVAWLLIMTTPAWLGPLAATVVAGTYAAYAVWAFGARDQLLPVVAPLGAAAGATVALVALVAAWAWRDRQRVASLFSRYVSRDVVRELVEQPGDVTVGGQRRQITVLFSDIRGFTSLSEQADAGALVDELNEYFEQMVQSVEAQRGTLDKFIGDGMMAFWGAPLEQEDHAERACAAALDMLDRLERVNERRLAAGRPPLEIGIGIHTGEAVVGNVGSPRWRVDFTAIGDTVNLASRLESSTKSLGVPILVSDATRGRAPGHAFEPHGSIQVKGRTGSTEVFGLVASVQYGSERHERPANGQAA